MKSSMMVTRLMGDGLRVQGGSLGLRPWADADVTTPIDFM
jgi:hypothetical protein